MSTSSESPGLSGTASGLSGPGISGAASHTTRSSSACPTTSARPASPSAVGSESTSRSPQTSPMRSYSPASTTVSASLSRTVWPLRSSSVVDRGRDRDPHPPPGGEHVDRLVGEPGQEHAVAAGRLRQPVDLLAERDELAARLLERLGELLVAGRELREPAGRLGEPLLEDARVPRGLGELAAQQGDFLFEEADLRGGLRGAELPAITWFTPAGTVVGVHGILPPCSVSIRYLPRAAREPCGEPVIHHSTGRHLDAAVAGVPVASRSIAASPALRPERAGRSRSAAGRSALRAGRDDTVGQPAGRHQERRVTLHAVVGPDREPHHVPRPDQASPRPAARSSTAARAGPRRAGTAGWWWRRSRRAPRPGTAPARRCPGAPTAPACPARPGRQARRRRRESARSATRKVQLRRDARRRTAARCARRARRGRRAPRRTARCPAGPTACSSEQVSAPDPAPASSTRAPGKTSPHIRICAASFG